MSPRCRARHRRALPGAIPDDRSRSGCQVGCWPARRVSSRLPVPESSRGSCFPARVGVLRMQGGPHRRSLRRVSSPWCRPRPHIVSADVTATAPNLQSPAAISFRSGSPSTRSASRIWPPIARGSSLARRQHTPSWSPTPRPWPAAPSCDRTGRTSPHRLRASWRDLVVDVGTFSVMKGDVGSCGHGIRPALQHVEGDGEAIVICAAPGGEPADVDADLPGDGHKVATLGGGVE